jgi:outer membrane lipoprotein-sorting protein
MEGVMKVSMKMVRITALAVAIASASLPAVAAPDGKQILKKMEAAMTRMLANGKSYQATIAMSTKLPESMQGQVPAGMQDMKIHMRIIPGKKARVEVAGGMPQMSTTMVDDGTNLWIYMAAMNSYMKQASQIAQVGGGMALRGVPMMGLTTQLQGMKAVVKGIRTIHGKPAYVVVVTSTKSGPMKIKRAELVVDKATNWLRQFSVSMSMGGHGAGKSQDIVSSGVIQDEQFDVAIPDSAFVFTPPEGAKEMQTPVGMGGAPVAPK